MSPNTTDPKCPCCDNPWAAATSDFFAKLCQDCDEAPPETKSTGTGIDRANIDFDVHPKNNFYMYANGNWLKNNAIPAGYPNWNSFLALHVKSQENLKILLTELSEKNATDDTISADEKEERRKLSLFYSAAADEDAVEAAGIAPLRPLLDLCASTAANGSDAALLAKDLGAMARIYGVHPFFGIAVSPDNKDTDHSIAQIGQGGLGLSDRDYYFDEDKASQRVAYKKVVAKLLDLLDGADGGGNESAEPSEKAVKDADAIFELELSLAEAHMTKTENRDPHDTYNKMSMDKLTSEVGKGLFDFGAYFESATGKTVDELGDVNVCNVKAMERMASIASSTPPSVLLSYLRWTAVRSCAPYLTKAFVDAHFDFYQRTLQGTAEMKPRWKRAMEFTEAALGEALGKLYCAKYFDETSKDRASAIVEKVRAALEERLKEVAWMTSDKTRNNALLKMSKFGVKIGYPDEWVDYSTLKVDDNHAFLTMMFAAREFDNARDSKDMNAPTDKKKWFMTPQTVNAYYHPNLNEIVFPAAILQPPLFQKDADDAVNFGAMGAVVGHEMTHGFDDQGRKFDHAGNMEDWWTPEDGKEYEKRVDVMVKQADEYEVHGQHVKGKLTSGENIADLGGLHLALRALKSQEGYDADAKVDGFSTVQRFFLSWGQCWRQNITKERSLQLLTLDPHGPNEMRCNGPLANMAEFHEAFGVEEEDEMYKEEEKRVDIW